MKICMNTLNGQEYVLNTDFIDRAVRFYMMSGKGNISEDDVMLSVDTLRAHKILNIREKQIEIERQDQELDEMLNNDDS